MRQRVMIAMAVACHPKLLIADEPTTALDVTTQAQVLDLLDDLRHRLGMAVLLITHDLGVVAQWADRISVMYAGRIVEQAGIEPFFAEPLHPYSRGLLGARVDVDADEHYSLNRLSEIPGQRRLGGGRDGLLLRAALPDRRARLPPRAAAADRARRARRRLSEGRRMTMVSTTVRRPPHPASPPRGRGVHELMSLSPAIAGRG